MTMYTGTEVLREFWLELGARMIRENRLFFIRFEKSERTFLAYRINSTKQLAYIDCVNIDDPTATHCLFIFEHCQTVVRTGFKDSSGRDLVLVDTESYDE
jgi:hypothetical protein|nr:MAG TPA: hypothetical protein [Caudoviricetes sp.]